MPMTTLAEMFAARDRAHNHQLARRQGLGPGMSPSAEDREDSHAQPQLDSELAFLESHNAAGLDGTASQSGVLFPIQRFAPEQHRPLRFTRPVAEAAGAGGAEREAPPGHSELAVRQHVFPVAPNPSLSPLDYPTADNEAVPSGAAQRGTQQTQQDLVYEGLEDLKRILTTRQLTASDLQGNLNLSVADFQNSSPPDAAVPPTEDSRVCMICLEEMKVGEWSSTLQCRHTFHTNCVVEWLAFRIKSDLAGCCPNCNQQIVMPLPEADAENDLERRARAGEDAYWGFSWSEEVQRIHSVNRRLAMGIGVFVLVLVVCNVCFMFVD